MCSVDTDGGNPKSSAHSDKEPRAELTDQMIDRQTNRHWKTSEKKQVVKEEKIEEQELV